MTLQDFFEKNPKAAIAFSGGVDSSYLLHEGLRLGKDIKAYYVKSQFQPEFEFADAKRLAQSWERTCRSSRWMYCSRRL